MIEILSTLFSYSFMIRALIAGTLVSLCAALLGVSLVLKRYSMIGDGLSHVGFGALSVATALNWAPMGVALPVVLLSAFLLLRLNAHGRVSSDAAIALVSSSSGSSCCRRRSWDPRSRMRACGHSSRAWSPRAWLEFAGHAASPETTSRSDVSSPPSPPCAGPALQR